jgi:hypothetical protein
MPPTATKKAPAKKAAARRKPAPAPEPEVEETDDDFEVEDEDLDELEEDEVEEAPAKSKVQEVTFGVADLCKWLTQKYDKKVTPRELRTLIRKMARDGSGRVDREITPGNRTRYDWPDGLKDPEVKKIVKAFASGELEADKQEKLQALKDRKKEKDAEAGKTKGAATKKAAAGKKRTKPAPVEEVEDDDEDLELDDEE